MKKSLLFIMAILPCLTFAQPVVFDFNAGIPSEDMLGTERVAVPERSDGSYPFVQSVEDEELKSKVYQNIDDPSHGGVYIRSAHTDTDELGGELDQFTYFMKFKADPLSSAPMFFVRLIKGTSTHPGFIRFRSQTHSEDDSERKGTFRLSIFGADAKEPEEAISTLQWIQQKGVWYWVGVVFDHGKVTFYQDGIPVGDEVAMSAESIPAAGEERYQVQAGYGFLGSFDDVVFIPNKALDAKTMQEFYEKGIESEAMRSKLQ